MRKTLEKWLVELTGLPTASGKEDRVIAWVKRWVAARPQVRIRTDRFGNMMLSLAALTPRGREAGRGGPVVIEAHMDHPAFVVKNVISGREVEADFRGGVEPEFFVGTGVLLHRDGSRPRRGVIRKYVVHPGPQFYPLATVQFARPVRAEVGDVMTWDVGPARVSRGLLSAPACDNLAGVACALAVLDAWRKKRPSAERPDVRVLLTRAEEVGFVGAIGACRSGILPKNSRVIVLETSRSFADSPIGGGPIVRVGDKATTFDPQLTYVLSGVAEDLARCNADFRWQRKLMSGGTCNASAYGALGYTAACVCVPLGNYHNQHFASRRIVREQIAVADWFGQVELLTQACEALGRPRGGPQFVDRLRVLFEARRDLVGG
ncbi:MAG: M20/M25/M40 family metallo-hydrolase [Phycisphaeraceae bacterium]|nr:M20/M25/M40 family metallo-hydrolase [Phycisphaeraceae bacterium]